MIGTGANVRVYLACGVTDMRKGIGGLAALVESVLRQKPASGAVFAFRGWRGDRIKLLIWEVAAQLGHSIQTHNITEQYAPYDPAYLKAATAAIDTLLADLRSRCVSVGDSEKELST